MFVPLSHAPGHAQCDFGEARVIIGGVERKAHYLVLDLPHSDGCFVKAYPAETTEAFLDGRVSAFASLGGVPQYDGETLARIPNFTEFGFPSSPSEDYWSRSFTPAISRFSDSLKWFSRINCCNVPPLGLIPRGPLMLSAVVFMGPSATKEALLLHSEISLDQRCNPALCELWVPTFAASTNRRRSPKTTALPSE